MFCLLKIAYFIFKLAHFVSKATIFPFGTQLTHLHFYFTSSIKGIDYRYTFWAENNKSNLKHYAFIEKAIEDLLQRNCINEVHTQPYCSNPLTVAEGGDLRHVNQYIFPDKFKYEDLYTLAELFEEGDYFFTFDLKSGYHHVSIHKDFVKYLGFQWRYRDGDVRFSTFLVLPFGLNVASYVFTKILRPLVKKWRGSGIKAILYIDDGINGSTSLPRTHIAADIVRDDLIKAGFVINEDKSNFVPSQTGHWVGYRVNTQNMTFTAPHTPPPPTRQGDKIETQNCVDFTKELCYERTLLRKNSVTKELCYERTLLRKNSVRKELC